MAAVPRNLSGVDDQAVVLMRERRVLAVGFIEVTVWRSAEPLSGSTHNLEYRLAYAVPSECGLRHDKETGKGDRRRAGTKDVPCMFVSVDRLLDF